MFSEDTLLYILQFLCDARASRDDFTPLDVPPSLLRALCSRNARIWEEDGRRMLGPAARVVPVARLLFLASGEISTVTGTGVAIGHHVGPGGDGSILTYLCPQQSRDVPVTAGRPVALCPCGKPKLVRVELPEAAPESQPAPVDSPPQPAPSHWSLDAWPQWSRERATARDTPHLSPEKEPYLRALQHFTNAGY